MWGSGMSHDTLIHRAVRPAVRLVARTGVTPNALTALRLATGVGAGVMFAVERPGWADAGAAVLLVSLLLDRADGELARQTGRTSKGGGRFDLVADCLANCAALVGLGFGLTGAMDAPGMVLGVVSGVSVGVLFWLLNVAQVAQTPTMRLGAGACVDADDAMLLLPVLVWVGAAVQTVEVAGVVTPLAVALTLLAPTIRRMRERPREAQAAPARRSQAG